MHKRLGTTRHDGTSDSSNWICTGPVWQLNADGTTVTNAFDTAKRIKTSTRYTPFGNVQTTYDYVLLTLLTPYRALKLKLYDFAGIPRSNGTKGLVLVV